MCLGIPGKIISVYENNGLKMGIADYNSVQREVCLTAVPDIAVGEYVIVHAGFAINKLSQEEALETLSTLDEINQLEI